MNQYLRLCRSQIGSFAQVLLGLRRPVERQVNFSQSIEGAIIIWIALQDKLQVVLSGSRFALLVIQHCARISRGDRVGIKEHGLV